MTFSHLGKTTDWSTSCNSGPLISWLLPSAAQRFAKRADWTDECNSGGFHLPAPLLATAEQRACFLPGPSYRSGYSVWVRKGRELAAHKLRQTRGSQTENGILDNYTRWKNMYKTINWLRLTRWEGFLPKQRATTGIYELSLPRFSKTRGHGKKHSDFHTSFSELHQATWKVLKHKGERPDY